MSNKRKTHHEGEGKKGKEHEEIKKSKGVSEVLEKAMNHSDIPGWVSEDAAVWSLINRQCFFPTLAGSEPSRGPSGELKRAANCLYRNRSSKSDSQMLDYR